MSEELLNPYDGARIALERTEHGEHPHYVIRVNGNVQEALPLPSRVNNDAHILVQTLKSVCRYINAGGDLEELQACLNVIRDCPLRVMTPAAPWELLSARIETDAPCHVLLNNDTGYAVVVKEDEYADYMTIENLYDAIN